MGLNRYRKRTLLLLVAALCGCTTSYNVGTQQQESLIISTEREIRMGESVAKALEEEYELSRDPEALARLDRVGQRVADVSDRKELVYRFSLLEEAEPNALALPGGLIYVTTGLLKLSPTDDELASVLGHEIGHAVAKHTVKRIQGALGLQALQVLVIASGAADPKAKAGMDVALASILTAYSQADELEADRLGTRYLKRAGLNPQAAISFLTKLRDHTYKQPSRPFSYFRTHPYFADRIRAVRQEATGQIQFDDYINVKD